MLLYEGKAKKVYSTESENEFILKMMQLHSMGRKKLKYHQRVF